MRGSRCVHARWSYRASCRSIVRNRPAEINLDLDDLAIPQRHDFGIAERLSSRTSSFIGHEHAFSIGDEIDEREAGNRFTIFPAPIEIGLAIDAIIARAGEMKITPDKSFDRGAILVDVGLIGAANDGDRLIRHLAFLV